jgi:hypothetical protein
MKFELKDNQAALIFNETEKGEISAVVECAGKQRNFVSFLCEAIIEKLMNDDGLWDEIYKITEIRERISYNNMEDNGSVYDTTEQESTLLHPLVNEIISRIDYHELYIEFYKDIVEFEKENSRKWELSEDETQLNLNIIENKDYFGRKFDGDARAEMKWHKQELENAKILFRIFMDTFNDGWEF